MDAMEVVLRIAGKNLVVNGDQGGETFQLDVRGLHVPEHRRGVVTAIVHVALPDLLLHIGAGGGVGARLTAALELARTAGTAGTARTSRT